MGESTAIASTEHRAERRTVNLRTKILDFRGFGSSRILILRAGILMSMGNFPESLSQEIFVWIILVVRLGVATRAALGGQPAQSLHRVPSQAVLRSPFGRVHCAERELA